MDDLREDTLNKDTLYIIQIFKLPSITNKYLNRENKSNHIASEIQYTPTIVVTLFLFSPVL